MDVTAYDSVPYPGHAHTATHPNRMAALARLFGVDAPAVAAARVLEIACGDGANLIPIAYSLPRAHCTGFDLAPTAIARAQQRAARLALRNCAFSVADLGAVDRSLGEFDYVIAHGLYSWVPAGLRDALLGLVADVLSPTGVAFVSCNVFPGWHVGRMVRDMMRFHVREIADPAERIEQARALLGFLAAAHDAGDPYGRLLAAECERMARHAPGHMFHDDLAEVNEPVYFHQFVEHAAGHGLAFLAEADFAGMSGAGLPEAARTRLDELRGDPVLHGQYLDFIGCRRFRESLLCRAAVGPATSPVDGAIRGLRVAAAAVPDAQPVDLRAGIEVQFRWGQRSSLKTDHPLAKAVFVALRERWPHSVSFDELSTAVGAMAGGEPVTAEAGELERVLLAACGLRMADLTVEPWPVVAEPAELPRASEVARHEAETSDVLTSLTHRQVRIDDPQALALLRLCDGSRDREALRLEVSPHGKAITADELGQGLRRLALLALLEA